MQKRSRFTFTQNLPHFSQFSLIFDGDLPHFLSRRLTPMDWVDLSFIWRLCSINVCLYFLCVDMRSSSTTPRRVALARMFKEAGLRSPRTQLTKVQIEISVQGRLTEASGIQIPHLTYKQGKSIKSLFHNIPVVSGISDSRLIAYHNITNCRC